MEIEVNKEDAEGGTKKKITTIWEDNEKDRKKQGLGNE